MNKFPWSIRERDVNESTDKNGFGKYQVQDTTDSNEYMATLKMVKEHRSLHSDACIRKYVDIVGNVYMIAVD